LDKAIRQLYQLVIPPIAKGLNATKGPDELHKIATRLRNELNKYGLADEEKIALKAEKVSIPTERFQSGSFI